MGNVWGEEASAEPEATKPSTEDVVEACPTPQEPLVEEGKSRHVGEEAMWSAHGPEVPKDLGAQVPGAKLTLDMPEPSSAETSPSVSSGQSDSPKEAASPQPMLLLPVANRRLISPSPANLSPLDQHLKANRWLMSPSHANSSHDQHMKVPSLLLGRATPQGLEDEEPRTPLKLLLPLDKRGSTELPSIVVSEVSPTLQSIPLSLLPSSPCRQNLRPPSASPSPSASEGGSRSQGQPRRSALKTPTTGKSAASSTKRVRFHEDVKPCPEDEEFFLYSVFAAGWQMLPQLF